LVALVRSHAGLGAKRSAPATHIATARCEDRAAIANGRKQTMNVLAKLLPRRSIQPGANADPARGLQAAAEWLARAQDATGAGGVSASYDVVKRQWAGAYPETTCYIIPTLFRYAE